MKKSEIVIIIVVAVVVSIVIYTYGVSPNTVSFTKALEIPGKESHVSGFFDKTQPVQYDEKIDPSLTVFYMTDKEGKSQKVYLHEDTGRPLGLENSESVDVHGSFNEQGEFHANDVLMKCPSKYNTQKHELATNSGN
jgi:cytochrome c-type biogenesis protein CcmE